jgi:hypothetical protein
MAVQTFVPIISAALFDGTNDQEILDLFSEAVGSEVLGTRDGTTLNFTCPGSPGFWSAPMEVGDYLSPTLSGVMNAATMAQQYITLTELSSRL